MASAHRFEDLIVWQKGRALVRAVYGISSDGPVSRDFAYKDQIRRAVLSVPSNVAEGFERGKRGEFHQLLSVAKGSCGEVRSLIYNGWDLGYMTMPVFRAILLQAEEVGRLLGGMRRAVAAQRGG